MRRAHVLVLSAVMVLLTLFVGGGALASQDAAPADYSDHPLVGTWMIDSDPENPENPLEIGVISAGGTMVEIGPDFTCGGAWEPIGDTTATLIFVCLDGVTIRTTIEVAADGQSFTAPYTIEFIDPNGESSGEIGPGTAEGTRINVEGPGTPVASLEEFFAEPEGTPGATPAT